MAGETGSILSTGQATLKLSVDKAAQTLTYSLTYSGLTNVLQAHIHFGKEHVAGGIMVFFSVRIWATVRRDLQPVLTTRRER